MASYQVTHNPITYYFKLIFGCGLLYLIMSIIIDIAENFGEYWFASKEWKVIFGLIIFGGFYFAFKYMKKLNKQTQYQMNISDSNITVLENEKLTIKEKYVFSRSKITEIELISLESGTSSSAIKKILNLVIIYKDQGQIKKIKFNVAEKDGEKLFQDLRQKEYPTSIKELGGVNKLFFASLKDEKIVPNQSSEAEKKLSRLRWLFSLILIIFFFVLFWKYL